MFVTVGDQPSLFESVLPREGLLALAVGVGPQVMAQLMEADVTAACGPRGKHDPDRAVGCCGDFGQRS